MAKRFEIHTVKLGEEIQAEKDLRSLPLGMNDKAIRSSIKNLEQTLVESLMLYSLYKKHHWQLLGPTFYQLHLLFDKHAEEQNVLIDTLAERIQQLGGVAIAMPQDVVERSSIKRPPAGAESKEAMITRLMDAHGIVIAATRTGAEDAEDAKDFGTNDLFVSQVLRTNELQLWFISSHLADPRD